MSRSALPAVRLTLLLIVTLTFGLPAAVAQSEPATEQRLAALRTILARPEFQAEEGRSALDALLDPIRTAIWSGVREVLRALVRQTANGGGGEGPSSVGLVVALVVVAAATLLFVRLARGTLADEAELETARPTGPPRAEAELARAAALASTGDLRGALHHHYLAALRRLDERDLLPFDGSLTNRELLPRARSNPRLAAALDPLVDTFDRLWYGQSSCTPEQYQQFARLAERVWQAAG